MNKKETLLNLVFKGNIIKIIGLGIIMLLSSLISIKISSMLMDIVDEVVPSHSIQKLVGALLLYFFVHLMHAALTFVSSYLQVIFELKINYNARPVFINRIFRQTGEFFVNNNGGELFQLIIQDVDRTTSFILTNTFGITTTVIGFICSFVFLCTINWKLTLVIILLQPFALILNRILAPIMTRCSDEQRTATAEYILSIQEVVTRPINLILSGLKGTGLERMKENMTKNYILSKKMFFLTLLSKQLASLIQIVINCAIVGYGGYCIINGNLTTGGLIMFLTHSGNLTSNLEALWALMLSFAELKPIYSRVNRYFIEPVMDRKGKIANHSTPDIVLDNVSFSYDDTKTIYDHISQTFSYGKNYGIVGRTGEGKSTLVKLIYNLWDVQTGSITIGNSNCYDIDPEEVGSILSYVSADSIIVHDTIYNNIAIGQNNISEKEVLDALKKVNLYDEVMEMEHGLDTILGDQGASISTGQQQRIMLARAMVSHKKIIILDEPTSALDEATSKKVMQSIYETFADQLLIIISHDKAALYGCNEVLDLNNGQFSITQAAS